MSSPFVNPGVPPIQPTPGQTDAPKMGPEGTEAKPFSLSQKEQGAESAMQTKQNPMEASQDRPASSRWSQDEMQTKLETTRQSFQESKARLTGPEGKALTKDHETALTKLTGLMNPDLRSIAQRTEGKYDPPALKKGESVVEHLATWLDGAQGAMAHALSFNPAAGKDGNVNPADFLKMQYSVQRALQRAEIFSNVIGSSVSGIKTLMSTQLG